MAAFLESLDRFEGRSHVRTWLFGILHNNAMERRMVESREMGEAIGGCMEGLPAAQREAFILREMGGLETGEMCKILGVSVTNMGVMLHRARHRLRECLKARGWRRKP